MKFKSVLFCAAAIFFLTNCGDNKTATNEKEQTNDHSAEKKTEPPTHPSPQADGIIGEWEMVGSVGDTNDILQIDEDERKNLKPTRFDAYMKLNSDGTGLFTVSRLEGRYEIKQESSGRKFMSWYDKANGRHRIGSIMKVTSDELYIKEPGGNGLFIWKRI